MVDSMVDTMAETMAAMTDVKKVDRLVDAMVGKRGFWSVVSKVVEKDHMMVEMMVELKAAILVETMDHMWIAKTAL